MTSKASIKNRTLRSTSTLIVIATSAALGLTILACEGEESADKPDASNLPPANVNLPPVPADLGVSRIPETHPDGSLTIDGLRRNRQAHLDKEVKVKGKVEFVYRCEHWEDKNKRRRRRRRRGAEDDAPPKMCNRHHFTIIDEADKDKDPLLIVNLSLPHYQEKIEEGELKEGMTLTISGTYTDLGDGFVETERGLIMMREIDELKPTEEDEKKKR